MELLIGISVLVVVFLLGALLSAGNERQRRAIDGIRLQAFRPRQTVHLAIDSFAKQLHLLEGCILPLSQRLGWGKQLLAVRTSFQTKLLLAMLLCCRNHLALV